MENKYYTPSIDEFYEGFEYERVVEWAVTKSGNTIIFHHELDTYSTFNFTFKDLQLTSYLGNQIEYYTLNEFVKSGVRVKYLDKEDIESLGWKITESIGNTEFEKGEKHLRLWFNKQDRNDVTILQYSELNGLTSNGKNLWEGWTIIFSGIIKNKSELIKLLKQLEIDEN